MRRCEAGPLRRIEKGAWKQRTNLVNIIINHKVDHPAAKVHYNEPTLY